ncbi:hypothetical protein [Maricaulis sp. CAU 1757]
MTAVTRWLEAQHWAVKTSEKNQGYSMIRQFFPGQGRGDVVAEKDGGEWIVQCRVAHYQDALTLGEVYAGLGGLLFQLESETTNVSIAMPDDPMFRGLWARIPAFAKQRTNITAFFVDQDGNVAHETD